MVEFDRFRVLFTPRTGSRALEAFLLTQPNSTNVGPHHNKIEKIPLDEKLNYAVARNPYDQLESWYHSVYSHTKYSMEGFITYYGEMGKFKPMNTYRDVVDVVFIYEHGLETIVKKMGFTAKDPIPVIGKSGKKHVWTVEEQKLAEKYFSEDFSFYAKWKTHGS
jgi:hypothetical protein